MELIHGLHKDTLVDIKGRVNERQGVPINLSNIEVGDYIKGYDTENGIVRYNKVVTKFTRQLNSYLELKLSNGTELKTSVDIKIFKDGEWLSPIGNTSCASKDCKCDSKLFFNDIKVTSAKYVEGPIELISIEVEPDHNYFVGDLLVHNTGPTGPRGAQGAQGSSGSSGGQGSQGPQGPKGNQGAQGPKGSQGAQGASPKGSQGAQGAQGPQGSTATGAQGPKGSQGAQGPQGAQGARAKSAAGGASPQGAQGPKGSQGAQGGQGAQGPQGAQGATGPQGAQGASPQGAQGAQGASPKGDQGAQGASPQGAQGATGSQGPQGSKGQKGASALGTLIGGAEIGAEGGFAYSDSDGLLTFQSGSTKFVVLMYTSGSS